MNLLERVKIRSRKFFNDLFLPALKLNLKHENALIVSGDPRGGTTWLSEIIMEIPKTVMVWEPLSIPMVKQLNKLNFSHRQYIPEELEFSRAKDYFLQVLSGNIFNDHLRQGQSYKNFINPKQTHVKFCRASQLLPWLTKHFEFECTPIYLVRHPCAVVASQLKQGGWDRVGNKFHIPYDKPYPEFYTRHIDFLESIDSKVKVLAAHWCLSNSLPLNHIENNKRWLTITYESLLIEGVRELQRIEDRWSIKLPESAYLKLYKPSSTTKKGSPLLEKQGNQLEYWNRQLNEKQIDEIMEVLNYFSIKLYNKDPLPTQLFR